MRKNKKIIAEIVALKKGDKLTAKQEAYVKARVDNKAYLKWKGLGEEMFPLIKIKKFYCENCFEENLESKAFYKYFKGIKELKQIVRKINENNI